MEGLDEDTEILMSPLRSLVKQLRAASKFARANALVLEAQSVTTTEATEEATPGIGATVDAPVLVDDLNHYVRSLFLTTEDNEPDDLNVPLALSIRTKKVKTGDTTVFANVQGPLQSYSVIELLQFAPHAFPASGIVVGDEPDVFGLRFDTCGDTLDAERAYCTTGTDHLYSTSKARPLLNLKNRTMVIDRVIREGGLHPPMELIDHEGGTITPVNKATSSVLRVLGLTPIPTTTTEAPPGREEGEALNHLVDDACAQIGAFWALLPVSETARTHLLTADPKTGPARIIVATLYAFASLLKGSAGRRLKLRFEAILSAVTTALLLCPCFALTSANDNTSITAYVDPFTTYGHQTGVDLLASQKDFSDKMTAVAKCFIVENATKVMIT